MVDITWADFNNAANAFNPVTGAVANVARAAVCGLYNRFPDFTQALIGSIPYTGGASAFMLPFACPNDPPPPPPVSPFEGGQCPKLYDVDVYLEFPPSDPPTQPPFTRIDTFRVWGTIKGVEVLPNGEGGGRIDLFHGEEGNPAAVVSTDVISWQLAAYGAVVTRIEAIRTVDGSPDECGNPLPRYPLVRPGPGDLSFPVDINVDGFSITVPLAFVFLDFSAQVSITPQINIDVGGVRVNFTIEGITFNFNPPSVTPRPPALPPIDPRPPADRPPPAPPRPPQPSECPDLDLTPVLRAIENLDEDVEVVSENVELLLDCDRCARPPISDESLRTQISSNVNSAVIPLPPRSRWVSVEQTSAPANAQGQPGFNAPNVQFSGWYSVGSQFSTSTRVPIQYRNVDIPIDTGMTKFSITLYAGHVATVTVYFEEDD